MGKRSRGGRGRRCRGALGPPSGISACQQSWERVARDQAGWRGLVGEGASEYEAGESARPGGGVHGAGPELGRHQRGCLALASVVLSATGGLELGLV